MWNFGRHPSQVSGFIYEAFLLLTIIRTFVDIRKKWHACPMFTNSVRDMHVQPRSSSSWRGDAGTCFFTEPRHTSLGTTPPACSHTPREDSVRAGVVRASFHVSHMATFSQKNLTKYRVHRTFSTIERREVASRQTHTRPLHSPCHHPPSGLSRMTIKSPSSNASSSSLSPPNAYTATTVSSIGLVTNTFSSCTAKRRIKEHHNKSENC